MSVMTWCRSRLCTLLLLCLIYSLQHHHVFPALETSSVLTVFVKRQRFAECSCANFYMQMTPTVASVYWRDCNFLLKVRRANQCKKECFSVRMFVFHQWSRDHGPLWRLICGWQVLLFCLCGYQWLLWLPVRYIWTGIFKTGWKSCNCF